MSSFQQSAIFASPSVPISEEIVTLKLTTDSHHKVSNADVFEDLSVGLATHHTTTTHVTKDSTNTSSGEGSYHNNSPQGESSDASIEQCSLLAISQGHGMSLKQAPISTHIAGDSDSFSADVTVINATQPHSQNSSIGSASGDATASVVSVLISATAATTTTSSSDNASSSPETNAHNVHAASSSFEEDHLLIGGTPSAPTSNVSVIRVNEVETNDPMLPRQSSPTYSCPTRSSITASTAPPTPLNASIVVPTSQTSTSSARMPCTHNVSEDGDMYGDCGIELEVDESGYVDEDDEKGNGQRSSGSSEDEPVSPMLSTSTALPPSTISGFSEHEANNKSETSECYYQQRPPNQQSLHQHGGCTSIPYSSHRSFRAQNSFVTSVLSAPPVHNPMGEEIRNFNENNIILNCSNINTLAPFSSSTGEEEDDRRSDISAGDDSSEGDEDLFLTRQRSDVWDEHDDKENTDFQLDDDNQCQYTSYSLSAYCGLNSTHKKGEDGDEDDFQPQPSFLLDHVRSKDSRRFHQHHHHNQQHNNNFVHNNNSVTPARRRTHSMNSRNRNVTHHHYSTHHNNANHSHNSSTSSNKNKKTSKGGKRNRNFALIASSAESGEADDSLDDKESQPVDDGDDDDDDDELVAGDVEDIELDLEGAVDQPGDQIDNEEELYDDDELGNEEDNEEGAFESDELDLYGNNYEQDYEGEQSPYGNSSRRSDAYHLNLEEQRSIIAFAKKQRANEYNEMMISQQHLRHEQQTVSIKILLNEAHRHQIKQLRSAKASQSRVSEAHGSWREVGFTAEDDFEDPMFVQRRLSCMCMFTPTLANRSYADNDGERGARIRRQHDLLMRLQEQRNFGGNPFFFEGPIIQGQHTVQLSSEYESCKEDDDVIEKGEEEEHECHEDSKYIPRRSECLSKHLSSPNPTEPAEDGDEDESKKCYQLNNEYDWIHQDPTFSGAAAGADNRGSNRYDYFQFTEEEEEVVSGQEPCTQIHQDDGADADAEPVVRMGCSPHRAFDDDMDESDALLLSVL